MAATETGTARRVALLGLMLESNRFAPVTTEQDFRDRILLQGDEMLADLASPEPRLPAEMRSFVASMEALHAADPDGPRWQPVPIRFGLVEAAGPVDHAFFSAWLAAMRDELTAALPLDGVYVCNHGAMISTDDLDPDGSILAAVREIVGPDVPVVVTLDLHGNVSERMVSAADAIVAYRTNPHVDMRARGAEAAGLMAELWAGTRTETALCRLPLVAPTVTQLTAAGPYAEIIDFGQTLVGGAIANVSVLGGFVYADTPKNGMAVVVTARGRDGQAARIARRVADRAWAEHRRFVPALTSLDEAVARVAAACADPSLPALALADVADNPGGGASGNTMWIIEALHRAGVQGVVAGIINDPALAAEAAQRGTGARFRAVFNRDGGDGFSHRFEAEAEVVSLHSGVCVGRRGFYAGRRMDLGQTAMLDLGGIRVVVVSIRTQLADPVFLEMMGVDIGKARAVVVKSRGHFRAGFDEFFAHEQVLEVDVPGLSSPMLERFDWQGLPRPVFPIDRDTQWRPQATAG